MGLSESKRERGMERGRGHSVSWVDGRQRCVCEKTKPSRWPCGTCFFTSSWLLNGNQPRKNDSDICRQVVLRAAVLDYKLFTDANVSRETILIQAEWISVSTALSATSVYMFSEMSGLQYVLLNTEKVNTHKWYFQVYFSAFSLFVCFYQQCNIMTSLFEFWSHYMFCGITGSDIWDAAAATICW